MGRLQQEFQVRKTHSSPHQEDLEMERGRRSRQWMEGVPRLGNPGKLYRIDRGCLLGGLKGTKLSIKFLCS